MTVCRVCTPRVLTPEQAAAHARHAAEAGARRGAVAPYRAALLTAAHWAPGDTIRYCFGGGNTAMRAAVTAAMRTWMRYANVTFLQVYTDALADVRVGFDPALGSWSYLGTECRVIPKTEATANMGWPDDPARDLHEVGHVLGLVHEHQIPGAPLNWDREAVYRYFGGPPNGWSRAEVDAQILDRLAARTLTNGGFDRQSVMLYAFPPQLLPPDGTPWNQHLSDGDKGFVARIYPR